MTTKVNLDRSKLLGYTVDGQDIWGVENSGAAVGAPEGGGKPAGNGKPAGGGKPAGNGKPAGIGKTTGSGKPS